MPPACARVCVRGVSSVSMWLLPADAGWCTSARVPCAHPGRPAARVPAPLQPRFGSRRGSRRRRRACGWRPAHTHLQAEPVCVPAFVARRGDTHRLLHCATSSPRPVDQSTQSHVRALRSAVTQPTRRNCARGSGGVVIVKQQRARVHANLKTRSPAIQEHNGMGATLPRRGLAAAMWQLTQQVQEACCKACAREWGGGG